MEPTKELIKRMDPPICSNDFIDFYRCSEADRTDPLDRDTAVPVIQVTWTFNIETFECCIPNLFHCS